jgi:hypothetical protein
MLALGLEKLNKNCPLFLKKMEILVNRTGSNYALIKRLDNKVHSMINLVERIPIDTTKEENDLKMALEALLRKRNERKLEEVKNA